jgi:uncharacterized protein (DUF1800 family)
VRASRWATLPFAAAVIAFTGPSVAWACPGGPDADTDGVCDASDNCLAITNPAQIDTDLDGYGNACDGDFDDNGFVNANDFATFGESLGAWDPELAYDIHADADANGRITGVDRAFFSSQYRAGRPGPSGLACAGHPPCAGEIPPPSQQEHVLNRITYGPTAESRARIRQIGVVAFIREQLAPERIVDGALDTRLAAFPTLGMDVAELVTRYDDATPLAELTRARMLRILTSKRQLEELLVDFWLNHFNVYAGQGFAKATIVAYERDAIRPHVLGRFVDLLRATARSPAMLEYLDNRFNTRDGLNENYGRELLELHTIGVDSGFTRADVRAVARALTGWSIDLSLTDGFRFYPARHDDRAVSLFGTPLIPPGLGERGGFFLLDHLARRSETAAFVCRKLVARFVDGTPPERLVTAAARTFGATGGDLAAVMSTILFSPEFLHRMTSRRSKVKRPAVLIGSLARTLRADPVAVTPGMLWQLETLGEPPFRARFPTGYPEASDFWASPGRFAIALSHVQGAVRGLYGYNPALTAPETASSFEITDRLIAQLLPDGVSGGTRSGAAALAYTLRGEPRAARLQQVAAFLLSSPEFLLH